MIYCLFASLLLNCLKYRKAQVLLSLRVIVSPCWVLHEMARDQAATLIWPVKMQR